LKGEDAFEVILRALRDAPFKVDQEVDIVIVVVDDDDDDDDDDVFADELAWLGRIPRTLTLDEDCNDDLPASVPADFSGEVFMTSPQMMVEVRVKKTTTDDDDDDDGDENNSSDEDGKQLVSLAGERQLVDNSEVAYFFGPPLSYFYQ